MQLLRIVAAFVMLGLPACIIDIDRSIACGDGEVTDGEDCDPGAPESFRFACDGRPGSCTPDTCQLQCCGDNIVNGEEECDGLVIGLVGPDGPDGEGDTCRYLNVPGTDVPYVTGNARCSDECTIDRSECSLCGNGQVDTRVVYPNGSMLASEVCDGGLFRREEVWGVCAPACDLPSDTNITCNVSCQGCRLLLVEEPINCCYPEGAPIVDDRYPCCCATGGNTCEFEISPGDLEPVCSGVLPKESG